MKWDSTCKNKTYAVHILVNFSHFIGSKKFKFVQIKAPLCYPIQLLGQTPLILFLNSSQQTLLNLELLLSNRDRHSRKLMSEKEMRKDVNISWDMNCSKT